MKPKPYHIVTLILIIILGICVRVWNLPSQSYWMDESFTIVATQAIEEKGTDVLDSGFTYSCPLYCYPSAGLARVLGDTPLAYRLLATVAGILVIPLIYVVSRRMFSKHVALLSSAFVALSYFQIAWSRQARWYTLFELFFWASIYFFYTALYTKENRIRSAIAAVVFAGLAMITHELGYLLPLIFVLWMVLDAVLQKRLSLKIFSGLVLVCAVGLASAIALFPLRISFELPAYLNFYLRSYWVFVLLAAIALIHPSNSYKKESWFLSLLFVAYLIPLSFLSDIVNYRYLFHVTPVLYMLAAIGVFCVMSDLKYQWQKIAFIPVVLAVFILSGQGVLLPRTDYFLEADDPSSFLLKNKNFFIFVPQPNWSGAYAYISANKTPEDVVITTEPAFNKIYLNEPGYWIRYSYNGKEYMKETTDNREFYVGASIIRDVPGLIALTSTSHGFVTIDVYAEKHIPQDILAYIQQHMTIVFHEKTNSYSEVWVYRF